MARSAAIPECGAWQANRAARSTARWRGRRKSARGLGKNKNGAVASAVLVHQTRGSGPLRLALAGATRSGTAGVGSLARSADEATSYPPGDKINFGPAAITDRDMDGHIGNVAWGRDEQGGALRGRRKEAASRE